MSPGDVIGAENGRIGRMPAGPLDRSKTVRPGGPTARRERRSAADGNLRRSGDTPANDFEELDPPGDLPPRVRITVDYGCTRRQINGEVTIIHGIDVVIQDAVKVTG